MADSRFASMMGLYQGMLMTLTPSRILSVSAEA